MGTPFVLYKWEDIACCSNGEAFPLPGDLCTECTCTDGSVRCTPLACPDVTCFKPSGYDACGCATCLVCVESGQNYTDGEVWKNSQGCECACEVCL